MKFDEFKGWLRGWLENLQDMDIPTATARILEELEKVEDVEDVEAAPLGPWLGKPYTTTIAKELGMDKAIELSAKSLFAQLRELGVNCRGCKHVGSGACPVNFVDVDFLCNQWQPTLPLPSPLP